MSLNDYIEVLVRRKWIFILTTLAAIAAAVYGTRLIQPTYEASATLRVAAAAGGDALNSTASIYSRDLINTTAQIASSGPMLDQVVNRLSLNKTPVVTATVVPNTELIQITVDDPNPKVAALVANTIVDQLIIQSNEVFTGGTVSSQDVMQQQLEQYKADVDQTGREYYAILQLTPPAPDKTAALLNLLELKEKTYETMLQDYNAALVQQQVRSNMITRVEVAAPPTSPIWPKPVNNYLLGAALGLILGLVLAFVVESLDPTLFTAKDIEKAASLSVLAQIPRVSGRHVLMAADDTSSLAEGFRNLATNVIQVDHQSAGQLVLIVGAEPRQGKSTVTANLARALAEYGKNVVAVDCDLRRPRLHKLFDLPNQRGLRNVLEEGGDLQHELRQPAECVHVLTSGTPSANPTRLLGSPNMAKLTNELRQQFDFVLLDTPALMAVPDTTAVAQNIELAQSVDMCILVVRRGHAERQPVQAAGQFIQRFQGKRAGIVVNQTGQARGYSYYRRRWPWTNTNGSKPSG